MIYTEFVIRHPGGDAEFHDELRYALDSWNTTSRRPGDLVEARAYGGENECMSELVIVEILDSGRVRINPEIGELDSFDPSDMDAVIDFLVDLAIVGAIETGGMLCCTHDPEED